MTNDPHSWLPFDETRIKSPRITPQRGRTALALIIDELGDFPPLDGFPPGGHPAYAPGRDPGTYVGAVVCDPREPAYSRYALAIALLGVDRYLPLPIIDSISPRHRARASEGVFYGSRKSNSAMSDFFAHTVCNRDGSITLGAPE